MVTRHRLFPLVLAMALMPGAASAQFDLNPMATPQLYRIGREKAALVNERCSGNLSAYLESVAYLFAYQQAAIRDGSFNRDPAFAQTFRNQFDAVVRRAQMCLKAYPPSSAGMRSDGSEPFRREAPAPGVDLPDAAPPGVPQDRGLTIEPRVLVMEPGAVRHFRASFGNRPSDAAITWSAAGGSINYAGDFTAGSMAGTFMVIASAEGEADTALVAITSVHGISSDAEGRTIPDLLAIIEIQRRQIAQLQGQAAAPAPPQPPTLAAPAGPEPARTGVEYRVRVKADNLFWHLHGNGDNLLSTRFQPEDDFTRFIIEATGDGAYRIRNKATGRYLYAQDAGSQYMISSVAVANDDRSAWLFYLEPDGSYRIANRAINRYVHEDGTFSRMVTMLYQTTDDYTRFFFVP